MGKIMPTPSSGLFYKNLRALQTVNQAEEEEPVKETGK